LFLWNKTHIYLRVGVILTSLFGKNACIDWNKKAIDFLCVYSGLFHWNKNEFIPEQIFIQNKDLFPGDIYRNECAASTNVVALLFVLSVSGCCWPLARPLSISKRRGIVISVRCSLTAAIHGLRRSSLASGRILNVVR